MKRKIGIILAVIATVIGLAAVSGGEVHATGRNGVIYCNLGSNTIKSTIDDCAWALAVYHPNELKACKIQNGEAKSPDEANCKKSIKSHISFSNGDADHYATRLANAMTDSSFSTGYKKSCYNGGNPTAQTECAKKENTTALMTGMSLAAKCYLEAHENDRDCGGSGSSSGSNSGSSSGTSNSETYGWGTTDVNSGDSCTSLLPKEWCQDGGIMSAVKFVIGVLTGTVVVAGTVGIIICGVLILTARDNEVQLQNAKKRLRDVVIGMIVWLLLSFIANLLLPTDKPSEITKTTETGKEKIL